jgi:hypothetical protein
LAIVVSFLRQFVSDMKVKKLLAVEQIGPRTSIGLPLIYGFKVPDERIRLGMRGKGGKETIGVIDPDFTGERQEVSRPAWR